MARIRQGKEKKAAGEQKRAVKPAPTTETTVEDVSATRSL